MRVKAALKFVGGAADEAVVEGARRSMNLGAQTGVFLEDALSVGVGKAEGVEIAGGEIEGGGVAGVEGFGGMSLGELLYAVLIEEGRTTDESA